MPVRAVFTRVFPAYTDACRENMHTDLHFYVLLLLQILHAVEGDGGDDDKAFKHEL